MTSYLRLSWSTIGKNKRRRRKARDEIRVFASLIKIRKALVGASFGIAEVKLGLMTSWFKAMMKMIKGPATSNNSTIKYMRSTSRILSMLTEFHAARPFSLEIVENVAVITRLNPSARKCHFSTSKIIKLIIEKEVSTKWVTYKGGSAMISYRAVAPKPTTSS